MSVQVDHHEMICEKYKNGEYIIHIKIKILV
jgi:hypothetical protein